jgi:hypothetical protein
LSKNGIDASRKKAAGLARKINDALLFERASTFIVRATEGSRVPAMAFGGRTSKKRMFLT